jgi:Lon protease-like protein
MTNWREMLKQRPLKVPASFPDEIILLEIDDAVLLPKGQLPLTLDVKQKSPFFKALAGDRLMGVVQVQKAFSGNPTLFKTGCLARIVAFSEGEESAPFTILSGLVRFRITKEFVGLDGARRAKVNYEPYSFDHIEEDEAVANRDAFIETIQGYCALLDLHPNWDEVLKTPDEILISALSMMCPFEAHEKQALLETATLQDRANVLTALMELACMKKQSHFGQIH